MTDAVTRPQKYHLSELDNQMNYKTGCLIPQKDSERLASAITYLLTDRNAALEMGPNGRELIRQEFTVKRMALETKKVYFSLLPSRN